MESPSTRQPLLNIILILALLPVISLVPLLLAGRMTLHQAEQALAEERFSEAARGYASAARMLFWENSLWEKAGQAALSAGDPANAIRYYNNLSTLSIDNRLALGDAYWQSGDPYFAEVNWNFALVMGTPTSGTYERLARLHRAKGDFSAEINDWFAYIQFDPEDGRAHYRLGLLLAATRPELALPELLQAAALAPELDASVQSLRSSLNLALLVDDRAYQLVMAGRGLGMVNEWQLAAEAFQRSTFLNPEYAPAWAWLGEAEQHLGRDGLADLEKALTLSPDSVMIQVLYGLYWQRNDQLEKAFSAFQIASVLEPQNPAWKILLGDASALSGDLVTARAYYQTAIEYAPADPVNWKALTAFCVQYNVDITEFCLPSALRLVALAPTEWSSWDYLGQVTLLTGDFNNAESILLKAVEMAPSQAAPRFHLGVLYMQETDPLSAYNQFVLARDLDIQGFYGSQADQMLEKYFP